MTTFGFILWVAGLLFEYRGIAVIGATIIVGVGAVVTDQGLQHQTGVVERTVDSDTTEVERQYSDVQTPTKLNLGTLIILIGGVLALHGLNDAGREGAM